MSEKIIVTGGCGFIGSHLVDKLIHEGYYVVVVDDLSAGTDTNYLKPYQDTNKAEFHKIDIRDYRKLSETLTEDYKAIFHLAAQPDVKVSVDKPIFDFDVNVNGSMNILELMRSKNIDKLVFASSGGTIYGEPEMHPTPENYPLGPISNYGAAKAAVEMYCSSYACLYDLNIVSLRLGNIFGPRSTHGVMFDFYNKLKKDKHKLTILGDGKQTKTYLYIEDAIEAFYFLSLNSRKNYDYYNVSSEETISVTEIADELVDSLNLHDVHYDYTGGVRGWKGDVIFTSSDMTKLKKKGWYAKVPIKIGIKHYAKWLITNYGAI